MSALTRTSVGHLDRQTAVAPGDLTAENLAQHLLSPLEAVRDLPQIVVTELQLRQMANGHEICLPNESSGEIAAVTADGLLAALMWHRGNHQYRPKRNFVGEYTCSS